MRPRDQGIRTPGKSPLQHGIQKQGQLVVDLQSSQVWMNPLCRAGRQDAELTGTARFRQYLQCTGWRNGGHLDHRESECEVRGVASRPELSRHVKPAVQRRELKQRRPQLLRRSELQTRQVGAANMDHLYLWILIETMHANVHRFAEMPRH